MATRRPVQTAPGNAWGPLPPHATAPPRPAFARWLEHLLLVVAMVCLGYYGFASAETLLYQAYEDRELDAILAAGSGARDPDSTNRSGSAGARTPKPGPRRGQTGQTVGRIEIPRLGVAAVIKAGTDARTLQLAVGHIPGTSWPGEPGNVGLAGHRDTFFRRLRRIKPDDEIRVTTPEGVFSYRVERTDVVEPGDVWVLHPTEYSALTLVTCYPFSYIGSAPQRFIVRAQLLSGADDEGPETRDPPKTRD
jgi:sortase A